MGSTASNWTTIGRAADFLAYHKDGNQTVKVQLKGGLVIDKKYTGKNIYLCFRIVNDGLWYLIPHDELVEIAGYLTPWLETRSWRERGSYFAKTTIPCCYICHRRLRSKLTGAPPFFQPCVGRNPPVEPPLPLFETCAPALFVQARSSSSSQPFFCANLIQSRWVCCVVAVYFFQIVVELTQQYLVGTQQLCVIIENLRVISRESWSDSRRCLSGGTTASSSLPTRPSRFVTCRSPFDASLTPLRTLCHFHRACPIRLCVE